MRSAEAAHDAIAGGLVLVHVCVYVRVRCPTLRYHVCTCAEPTVYIHMHLYTRAMHTNQQVTRIYELSAHHERGHAKMRFFYSDACAVRCACDAHMRCCFVNKLTHFCASACRAHRPQDKTRFCGRCRSSPGWINPKLCSENSMQSPPAFATVLWWLLLLLACVQSARETKRLARYAHSPCGIVIWGARRAPIITDDSKRSKLNQNEQKCARCTRCMRVRLSGAHDAHSRTRIRH